MIASEKLHSEKMINSGNFISALIIYIFIRFCECNVKDDYCSVFTK